MKTPEIKIIADDGNLCGEAPIWDTRANRLLWADISRSIMYEYRPVTGVKTILSTGLMISGIALHEDGRLLVAGATGVHLWSGQDDYQTIVATHEGETFFCNDMSADATGRIYFGTTYWNANGMEKLGKLYLMNTDSSVRIVDDGIELANGIGFSPDGRTLYFADSTARRIYAYDVETRSGALSRKRVFVQVPGDEGIPDGLTVDADGHVWSAQWYGGQVVRYDPDGKVERRLAIPAKQTSSVAFGGKNLTDLYVTSAAEPWPSDYLPPGCDLQTGNVGGALYRISTDVQGRAEPRTRIKERQP